LHPHVWYAVSDDAVCANIVFSPYQPVRVRPPWGDACDHNLQHRAGQLEPQPATELQAQSGRDAHSQTADACLVDPAQGDYRVWPDSPALALGFRNFPMDNFGVRSPALRALARTPCLPPPGEQPPAFAPKRDRTSVQWHGSEVRNVAGWGDVSAAGLPGEIGVWVVAPSGELLEDDVILEVDGVEIRGTDSLLRLATPPVRITVWRNQQRVHVATMQVSAT
jgi:hypothetical protein